MKKTNERRQINIPKSDYDALKEFCDMNGLDMPKWIVIKLMEIIKKQEKQNVK